MKTRKIFTVLLALLLCFTLLLAGCTGQSGNNNHTDTGNNSDDLH